MFLLDSNPTVERIAKLIFDKAAEHGLPVVRVTVWETPTSFAGIPRVVLSPLPFALIVFDLDGTLVDSRRDIAEAANTLLEECGAAPLPEERIGRMVGDGAATLVARAFAAAGMAAPADALERFVAIYGSRLLLNTRPYPGIPDVLSQLSQRAALAVLTNKPIASTRRILDGLDLARYFPATPCSAATARFRASRVRRGCSTSQRPPAQRQRRPCWSATR